MHVCLVSGHGFDPHRLTSSERNGQPHWLNPANIEHSRIPVSHQGGFILPLSLPKMIVGNRFPKWAKELIVNTKIVNVLT